MKLSTKRFSFLSSIHFWRLSLFISIFVFITFVVALKINLLQLTVSQHYFKGHSPSVIRVDGNDFIGELLPLPTRRIPTSKTASVHLKGDEVYFVEQRYDFEKIWQASELGKSLDQIEPFIDFNGGIKQHFYFNNHEFILATLKTKSSEECYFSSLINLSIKSEIFRTPCLPKSMLFDFNGIGGGYAERGGLLYLAIGAPEYTSASVRKFAQDPKSPYGKVIIFDQKRLKSKPKDLYEFKIFTSGHRNPQGMVNIDGEIFEIEHGPKGGDEINFLSKESNYGWPIYSLGSAYPSEQGIRYKIADGAANFKMPMFAFIPSVGSSDIRSCPDVIANRYQPMGCLLVSSLRAQSLFVVLFDKKTRTAISVEKLLVGMRIREFAKNTGDRIIFSVDDAAKGTSGIYELNIKNDFQ